MKKIAMFALVMMLGVFVLGACGKKEEQPAPAPAEQTAAVSEEVNIITESEAGYDEQENTAAGEEGETSEEIPAMTA
ncbi:MAG: hypothetical protein LBR69_07825 [Endomicrobium sp.]|jgi:ABC-type glycerol-3-phosphate transport system substrate-binding protein|nr:hypothetical protein [Endomicrobium sp.]